MQNSQNESVSLVCKTSASLVLMTEEKQISNCRISHDSALENYTDRIRMSYLIFVHAGILVKLTEES